MPVSPKLYTVPYQYSHPVLVAKTRLPLILLSSHPPFHPLCYLTSSGLVRTFKQLLAEGGVTGLWRGGLPNVQRAALINMGELTTYDTAKRWYAIRFQLEDGPFLHICSSATSGFVAAIVGTPADMIKTRIMNQRASHSDGLFYKGVIDCATKVVRNEGFFALYKGFFLIWARIVSMDRWWFFC
ncbi:unnamed protein product [Echinostoma caproni]|uniref:Kidney mitochondrial carrier protein 1 n=1 Tax=Echinostoma caproni TaxID=27848 RepID=A0A183AWL2_9TREM|nr:unnamed protein product [Echinostoma caproni]